MSKITARTKAALAVLHVCEGHDDKADALAEAFAIVDHAVQMDLSKPAPADRLEKAEKASYGLTSILKELGADDYLSALRIIGKLKGQATHELKAEQTRAEASFNERAAKLAVLQLESRIQGQQATIDAQGWDLEHARRRIEELEDFAKRFFDWGDTLVFDDEADPLIPLIDEAGKLTLDHPKGEPAQEDNPDEIL